MSNLKITSRFCILWGLRLCCIVLPLSVYPCKNTKPQTAPPSINTLEDKIYGLSTVWSEMKYNFVNIDLIDFDIDSLYRQTLSRVIASSNDVEYYDELERFLAKFNDGHTGIWTRGYDESQYINDFSGTIGEFAGHYYFIALKKNAGIDSTLLGAEVIEVGGLPVREHMKRYCFPQISASTEQYRWRTALRRLHRGPVGEYFQGKARTEKGDTISFSLPYNWETSRTDHDDYWSLQWGAYPPPGRISVQWYGNMARVVIKDFHDEDMTDKIDSVMRIVSDRNPEGLILDLRYNRGGISDVGERLQMYIDPNDTIRSFGYETRINNGYGRSQGNYRKKYEPFYIGKAYKKIKPQLIVKDPEIKSFTCPVVCLIGPSTYSACEDFLINIYELPDRPVLIGKPTGGSTGAPLCIDLPHGGIVRICTLRPLFPYSGKRFVNQGIQPDIMVRSTLDDEKQKRDVVLEKAIQVLNNKICSNRKN